MGRGKSKCPICGGKGVLTENQQEYEFVTRDPLTARCLICSGSGEVNAHQKLPNGIKMHELKRWQRRKQELAAGERGRKLNVSRGARIRRVTTEGTEITESADYGKEGVGLDSIASLQNDRVRLHNAMGTCKDALVIERNHALYLPIFRELREWGRAQGQWDSEQEAGYVEALERRLQDMERLGELIDNATKEAENGQ